MSTEIYRFQNITNYDTNVGGLLLRNFRDTTTGYVNIPIHVYDISCFSNDSNIAPGAQFVWADSTSSAALIRSTLPTQDGTGVTQANGTWHGEKNATQSPYPAVHNALHNWSDIRINLYGARKRTTYFDVMFITMKNEFADPLYAADTNVSKKLLFQYWERPLIYSNLQTDVGGKGHGMYKVLMRKRYYVSASQSTDVDTSVGKVKQVKIFMKHDRMRGYDWQHEGLSATDVLPHGDDDGKDFVRDDDVHNICSHGKRVFMVIKAFAPERTVGTTAELATPDANKDPSYDIIIRNSFSWARSQNS